MRELLRSTDPVLISFVVSVLNDAGIGHVVLDRAISSVEGSISIFPQRITVLDEDLVAAATACREAGIAAGDLTAGASDQQQRRATPAAGWLVGLRGLFAPR